MDALVLLGSPRGRRLCVELVDQATDDALFRLRLGLDDVASPDYCALGDDAKAAAKAEFLTGVDVALVAALSERAVVRALGNVTAAAMYWQPPYDDDVLYGDLRVVEALRPIADVVVQLPAARWWSDPVDVAGQRWVQWFDTERGWSELPTLETGVGYLQGWHEKAAASEVRARARQDWENVTGAWWSTPQFSGAPVTTSSRSGLAALRLDLVEDAAFWTRARVWVVAVDDAARICEINSARDWADLVTAFPLEATNSKRGEWFRTTGRDGRWLMPDWLKVADAFDRVHLTMTGYLSAAGVAIPMGDGLSASVIAGWDPDATYWLHRDRIALTRELSEHVVVDEGADDQRWIDDKPHR